MGGFPPGWQKIIKDYKSLTGTLLGLVHSLPVTASHVIAERVFRRCLFWKEILSMARLGKRERLEKRERLIQERRLNLVRKDLERQERLELAKLPQRERNWLVGRTVDLSVGNISGKQHTKNLYIGRSPGTGKKRIVPMPGRFKGAFMADGHEALKTSSPLNVPMVRVGTTPARKVAFVDKLTGERKFGRIPARPKFVPVGGMETPSIK